MRGDALPGSDGMPGRRWITTWTAAPVHIGSAELPPEPFTRDGAVLADATLRQTLRVSAGGSAFRLRLSNAFGVAELTITSAAVALPEGGRSGASSITARTSRPLTWGGRLAAVIPPGAHLVSDPVDRPLPPGATLTVTLYLAAGCAAGGVTAHPGSRTTSHLLPGRHVHDEQLPGAVAVDHWYFLSAVEAHGPPGTGVAVMLGDSLTDGRGSTTNGNDRWPDQLSARLRSGAGVVNQGIGGNRVLRDGIGASVLARLDWDVLAVSGVRWLVVFAGVNDIGTTEPTDAAAKQVAADLMAAYEQIIIRAHARGIRVYGATLTPFGGNVPYDDAQGHREAARQKVNAWLRGVTGFTGLDCVLDFDRAVHDPGHPARVRPALHDGDHLHLNPEGYRALAAEVSNGLFRPDSQAPLTEFDGRNPR
jgi:lysophospholipase L1-like esterase